MKKNKFPIKIWTITLLVIIWNVLVVYDIKQEGIYQAKFGILTLIATGIVDSFLFIIMISKGFRKLILKKGHSYKEIKSYVNIFFIVFTLFMISLILRIF